MPLPTYVLDQRLSYQDVNDIVGVINRIADVLTADPASPANDTWWIVRDGGSPQAVKLRVRIGGVSYTLAEITI